MGGEEKGAHVESSHFCGCKMRSIIYLSHGLFKLL